MNLNFEKKLWKNNKYIFGLDEVGRGPLAGPVVVCAVYVEAFLKLPKEILLVVKDSKKLSYQKRDIIVKKIRKIRGIDFAIAKSSEKEIDKTNILKATLKAFKKAVIKLEKKINRKPNLIAIDGNKIIKDLVNYKQQSIIKGDNKIFSIALASIIAKEYRDDLMKKYSKKYPKYGFEIHKGYGTKKHIECLKKFGCCEIHRKNFVKNILK
ncbi:MAG: ribonuclease HII [Candidatus Paceibacterota bacterium]|jgi:ribonuclease HII